MSEWKTIDTAPLNGTPVLLFYSGLVYVAFWETDSEYGPVWRTIDATVIFNPTHWMPLPEPPQ